MERTRDTLIKKAEDNSYLHSAQGLLESKFKNALPNKQPKKGFLLYSKQM